MSYIYKFEKFKNLNFPIYSSIQSGKGTIVIPHHHKAAEMILVINGSCDIYIDSEIICCKANDIIYIPPYSVHTVLGKNQETTIKGITFEFSLLDEIIKDFSVEAKLNKNQIIPKGNFLIKDTAENITKIIKNFSVFEENDSQAYRFMILGKLLIIVGVLLQQFCNTQLNNYDTRFTPVFEYIKNNYNHQIRISDLSSMLNICDDHFIKIFKSMTNKTPIKYINDLRIEESLKLLVDSDLSITQISEKVGFSSVNYMIKIFKDTLNITPKTYKKKKP